jgi:hypothetical protein
MRQPIYIVLDHGKNWWRVLGLTEAPQIDQHGGRQFHAIMPTLLVLQTQKQPLEFVLPCTRPLHSVPPCVNPL